MTSNSLAYFQPNYVCEYVIWRDFYEIYWIYIDASIYSFVPSFLIFTLNILIIKTLSKADKVNKILSGSMKIPTKMHESIEMVSAKRKAHRPSLHLSKSLYIKPDLQALNSLQNLLEKSYSKSNSKSNQNNIIEKQTTIQSYNESTIEITKISAKILPSIDKRQQSDKIIIRREKNLNLLFNIRENKSFKHLRNPKIISTRLIVMLITINISFCLFSMPMTILQIIKFSDEYSAIHSPIYSNFNFNFNFTNISDSVIQIKPNDSMFDLLHLIAEILQYLNHGSSFILYSISGKIFRNETKAFFRDLSKFFQKIFKKDEILK